MQSVLILGAGRSSTALIHYLTSQATAEDWKITVGDVLLTSARERVNKSIAQAIAFDIQKESDRDIISKHDIVISLLPAHYHIQVGRVCLQHKKHLLTASYVSPDMQALDVEAKKNGLLFLNECGLDPGIDHMSALQVIDRIKKEGGDLWSFESFTGGLIAPETDPENPWRYKFTWNPRNVVMAGQSAARYLWDGEYKYVPYQQLFKRVTPVSVPGYGEFEGYANRDSLTYRKLYRLEKVKTMLRGTLRSRGFCSAWDLLVQLGCTDDTYPMEDVANMTHTRFIDSFLNAQTGKSPQEKIEKSFALEKNSPELKKLEWSGLFDATPVGLEKGTPAQILEHILNKKWQLSPADRDMIVMWHRFRYHLDNKDHEIQSSLVVLGENSSQTAMAKTVGLPLAIAAKLLLQGKIKQRGVVIPTMQELYEPILTELRALGIALIEK